VAKVSSTSGNCCLAWDSSWPTWRRTTGRVRFYNSEGREQWIRKAAGGEDDAAELPPFRSNEVRYG